MYTIKNNSKYEIIIKKSKFITLLYKVDNINIIKDLLEKIKLEYPDASHYPYAYIIDEYKRWCDDGEPSKTSGLPILKVLENKQLNHVLAVVVRYFGGIKLGASGLIRAYSKSVINGLDNNCLLELIKGYNINIYFTYNELKKIDYLLKDININNKIFDENICYNIDIPISFIDIINKNNIKYKIIKEILIEK